MADVMSEHKVRGGSALSLALARSSPPLDLVKSSPTDSDASALTSSHARLSLSDASGLEWPSPAPSPATAAAGSQFAAAAAAAAIALAKEGAAGQQRLLGHSAATGPQAAAAAAALQQQQQQQEEHDCPRQRRRLPFLACFGSTGVLGEDPSVRYQPAVSSSEVGIRPCFYWLESPLSEEDRMCAEANARWLKSDCQDDAVVIEHFAGQQHQTFAGVFDGHGPHGRASAKFASTRLPQLLAAKAAAGGGGSCFASERKRQRAMREAFLEVNASMRDYSQVGFDASLSGTTACCALVVGQKVLVASTGDSRCVVARRGANGDLEAVPLTWDAKPSLPEEQKRIAMAGGVVKQLLDERGQRCGAYRVFSRGDDVLPGLAMSRSLGDLYAHEVGVSPEPITSSYTLGERDLFMILATDGLWDIMGNDEAADFVERYKARRDVHVSCAEALTLEAQERWKALHDEAIVDDISCVILHTSGLPPPELDNSVPRRLARAASCNDEANELYAQWRVTRDRNPSNHKPQQYFKHLYGEGEDSSGSAGSSSLRAAAAAGAVAEAAAAAGGSRGSFGRSSHARRQPSVGAPSEAAEADAAAAAAGAPRCGGGGLLHRVSSPPPPPASPVRLDAPQYAGGLSLSLPGSSSSPRGQRLAALGSPSLEGVLQADELSSPSPISSYGDLASEGNSNPSMSRGSAFAAAAFSRNQNDGDLRRTSIPQPIPMSRKESPQAGPHGGQAKSFPVEVLLRPVRKAYPSSGNMQQMGAFSYSHSYSSGFGGMLSAETPRSGDSPGCQDHKVRGGNSRSQSTQRLHTGYPSLSSMPQHPSNASLLTSCRTSSDFQRGSAPGSPSAASDGALGSPWSPQLSPAVVPLGGGYTRFVQVSGSRVHSLAPLASFAGLHPSLPAGNSFAVASLEARADLADLSMRSSHLSRHATDTAALVEALGAIDEAGGAYGTAAALGSCEAAGETAVPHASSAAGH